jgi:4-amino-4-deoxy-L-arabinose transferase-like glycosyltransferase
MIKIERLVILILILLIASLFRLIGLDSVPPHLSNDEISIAYDAYSVLKTGHDEHHHFLPLSFESHGTYKAPLPIYLTIPTTFLLGNTDYAVRLPSAILGIFTVFILGLLIYEISKSLTLSLTGCFILAIDPWHIYSSRMALESNVALFFICLGLYLFFYGMNRKNSLAVLGSFISLGLSLYSYHTEWGFVPLLLLSLFILYRKGLVKQKAFYIGALVFLLLSAFLLLDFVQSFNSGTRASSEIIFQDPFLARYLADDNLNFLQKSRIVADVFVNNYFQYTNFSYLFFTGLDLLDQHDIFQIGLFLFPFLPCFIVGFLKLKKYFKKHWKFVLVWVLISPLIPAATRGGVNNVRNLVSVLPYTLVISTGCLSIWEYFKGKKILKISAIGLVFISFCYFLTIYFYHFPFAKGINLQYGYKQVALYIKPRYSQFKRIVVDPRFGVDNIYSGVPHLYLPYYTMMDPRQMFKRKETSLGLLFDKYEFRNIKWDLEKPQPLTLYVVSVSNLPPPGLLKLQTKINLPNHQVAFEIYSE